MPASQCGRSGCGAQRGAVLVLLSAGMVMLLGVAGLAIDLAGLYVARSEAQRAADAAALAGAKVFAAPGATSGGVLTAAAIVKARQRAIDVGGHNSVGNQTVSILPSDVTIDVSNPGNPVVTVVVERTSARSNPMPTFFVKIFGIQTADIGASATAEAFNPSASSTTTVSVGAKCLKPFLLPNCDALHPVNFGDPNANTNCLISGPGGPGSSYASYFINPNPPNPIVNPGATPGGVIGQLHQIKPGSPNEAAASSKFYPVFLPTGGLPSSCPSCASGGGAGGGAGSGSLYRDNIACCNQNTISCGATTIQPITGNMVGPTRQGVQCLIHQSPGSGGGQDTLTPAPPFPMFAGFNNPFVPQGTVISTSDSVVNIPLYDGATLCPGASCPASVVVNIVGFLEVFIKEERNPQGTVDTYILNVAGCQGSTGGSGGGGTTIVSSGGSLIPIRLIHQ